MPWSKKAKANAIILIAVVVPALMFGLGVAGFFLAEYAGLGSNSVWIALSLSTLGLIISILITLRVGRQFETERPTPATTTKKEEGRPRE
jgi:uncharacterized membrane protein